MPSIGIILIVYSLLFYSNNTLHPSYITLVPVIGVCFVIWFSSKNEILLNYFLQNYLLELD